MKDIIKNKLYCIGYACEANNLCDTCKESFKRGYQVAKAKYEWHDLRNNPNDLPEKEGQYLCCVKINKNEAWGIEEGIYYDVLSNKGKSCFTDTSLTETIGWREIEPFEED